MLTSLVITEFSYSFDATQFDKSTQLKKIQCVNVLRIKVSKLHQLLKILNRKLKIEKVLISIKPVSTSNSKMKLQMSADPSEKFLRLFWI